MRAVRTVGIAGTGLIGAGWAARLLIRGIDVIAYDVAPAAEPKLRAAIEVAWPSMTRLLGVVGTPGELRFTTDLADMARSVDFIHEAAPEREELKIALFRDLDAIAPPDVLLASSSSGFLPSRLQSACRHPERVLIAHPFNPVYLLPLVETVPGATTSAETMDRAREYLESIGMHVLQLRTEIEGYVCDRLQEALWREALHILDEDIGSTGDLDDAIVYSAGMRWAFMGSFLTYHVAGGPGGMRDFLRQFDPTLELPWTELRFPQWNAALEQRLVEGCEAQAAQRTVAAIEAQRNDVLVDMMKLFRCHGVGAGQVLAREEARARRNYRRLQPGDDLSRPLALSEGQVLKTWLDYNGHMTDVAYPTALNEGQEAFLNYLGFDEAYRAAGGTLFTAAMHINYFREMKSGERYRIETQVVGCDAKRMHLVNAMIRADSGERAASNEIMLLHVDTASGKVAPMRPALFAALSAVWQHHQHLPRPAELGRVMQLKRPA